MKMIKNIFNASSFEFLIETFFNADVDNWDFSGVQFCEYFEF